MELNCPMTRCPLCAPGFTGCQGSIASVSGRPKALVALAVQYFVNGVARGGGRQETTCGEAKEEEEER
jgi:hypothetical protein